MSTEIIKAEEFGIEEKKASEMTKGLKTILSERELLINEFEEASSLEVNEDNIPSFKALRLRIRDNRTKGINNWHKKNKAFFLRGGQFVDAIKNKEKQVNEEMESKLMEAEKHFENLEIERLYKLQKKREKMLIDYVEDVHLIDLSVMEDDVFEAYLSTKKKKHEDEIAEEKRIEEKLIEKDRLDRLEQDRRIKLSPYSQFNEGNEDLRSMPDKEYNKLKSSLVKAKKEHEDEQEKIRKENERLRKEREEERKKAEHLEKVRIEEEAKAEKIAKIKEEKEAKERREEEEKRAEIEANKEAEHQAQLKKEREAREELERKEKERKQKEEDRIAKEAAEKEKLAKAPVKDKMNKWVNDFSLPETSVDNEISKEIETKFDSFKKWSLKQVENL